MVYYIIKEVLKILIIIISIIKIQNNNLKCPPDINFCYQSYNDSSIPVNLINIYPQNILVFDNNDINEQLLTEINYILINNSITNFKNFRI
jgi:hypothetical protein